MPSSQLCSCVSPPSALTLPARPARMQSTRYGTRIYTETVDKLELLKVVEGVGLDTVMWPLG